MGSVSPYKARMILTLVLIVIVVAAIIEALILSL